ncbi:MAG: YfiR family protein [Bacteroidales bacterium]|nr:YfiR family protein [Bacteroidales bacterium]
MKKYIGILVLLLFISIQKTDAQDDKFKALMIYNFTRVIGWPADYAEGDFLMQVIGESQVLRELTSIAQTKKVGAQNIKVKGIDAPSEMGKCHIIYVPSASNKFLPEILSSTAGSATLVITDKKGLQENGSCINFFAEDGQLKYEVLMTNMKTKGLIPSMSLTEPENAVKIE